MLPVVPLIELVLFYPRSVIHPDRQQAPTLYHAALLSLLELARLPQKRQRLGLLVWWIREDLARGIESALYKRALTSYDLWSAPEGALLPQLGNFRPVESHLEQDFF